MPDEWGDSTGWGTSGDADGWGSGGGGGGENDAAGGEKKKDGCFKCGESGHFSRECPKGGGGGGGGKGCFNCGEEGHRKSDCPNPPKPREGGDGGGPKTCRRCGEEGHIVKDCPKEETTRVRENEDGTKTEIYVPKEIEHEKLFDQGITSGINFDKFEKIPVKTTGDDVPKPLKTFEEANFRGLLNDNITKSHYKVPTPVQKHAIPIILGKRDLMACAQTGSGKTAAFLLPILHKLLEDGMGGLQIPAKPEAVIVAPTRELAIQIKDEARKFGDGSIIRSIVSYGGTSVGFNINAISRGVNVLIATPGRLMDLVEKGKVSFEDVRFFVLDEADRMLDMGFMPEVRRIVGAHMPAKGERQTLMFSATFPEEVQQLAKEFLVDNYVFLAVGVVGGASSDVKQEFHEVEKFGKRDKLISILVESGSDRNLVFVETKRNADFLASYLSNEGLPTTSIHGDRLQREREEALADFKSGKMTTLVATAVAARGLDIKGVSRVINYDLPKSIDEYVHRIGRTGRVGNQGLAISFFDPNENSDIASDLVRILSDSQQEVPDCLSSFSAGNFSQGAFGGKDIRKGVATTTTNAAEEEDWG